MPSDILTQGLGVLASAFIIFAFTHKSDNRFKIFASIGNILFAVHFFMLGAYAGSAVNIINAFRAGFSIRFHKSNTVMYFFIACYCIGAVLVFSQFIDLLPFVTGIIGSFAVYKLSGISMRTCMFVSSTMWMAYNIYFMSIGGIATETFIIMVNSITIVRLFWDKKKANET